MKKRPFKIVALSFSIVILVSFLLESCLISDIFNENKEWETDIRNETYAVDSTTLLEALQQGKSDVFRLLTATPPAYPPHSSPIHWTQADLFTVAQSIHQYAWKESLADWKVEKISFYLPCSQIELGPQGAAFSFFKYVKIKGEDARLIRVLFITPDENTIVLSEYKFQPVYEIWSSINLLNEKVSVEDAVSIAEKNGGIKFRQEVGNKCSIEASRDIDNGYDGWLVTYSESGSNQDKSLKWENINAQTGEYQKVQ